MTSATVDSNVLVSAPVFGGRPLRVLELALEGGIRLDISGEIFSQNISSDVTEIQTSTGPATNTGDLCERLHEPSRADPAA